MINYGRQSIDKKDIQSVVKVLKSDYLTQGPVVKKFETELSTYFKSKFALAVSSGTSALNISSKILKWKKNDIVFVSPITFLASSNCIEESGATPYFIDINLEDYSINLNLLEKKLKEFKKRVKAVVVTDYAGHPADWIKIKRLKRKFKFKIINDNCHAMGASMNGNFGYSSKYADITILSFHPVKAITTGEGGAILTNNKLLFEKAKNLRSHGVIRNKKLSKKFGSWYYEMIELGGNYRLSDLNASLGSSQLKKINKFIKKRNYIAKFYNNLFKDETKFQIPKIRKNITHAFHLYPLLVNLKKIGKSKKEIFNQFKNYKINLQVHYIPINTQPYYKKKYGMNKNDFKNSLNFYKKEISMPIYFGLTKKQLSYISKICKKVFNLK
tara:strand:- start:2755 stop:3909 length:1155 start_codon:yes stop_codon:yes gene_type:complete